MEDFASLVGEHDQIIRLSRAVAQLCVPDTPDLDLVTFTLERLARLVRDHLGHEDGMIYETVEASKPTPHADTARHAAIAFERLKHDWGSYLYRWDRPHVAARWLVFVRETDAMLARLVERVEWETAILYSLALHHGVMLPRR